MLNWNCDLIMMRKLPYTVLHIKWCLEVLYEGFFLASIWQIWFDVMFLWNFPKLSFHCHESDKTLHIISFSVNDNIS